MYSLGMVMYQLFESQVPFVGEDPVKAARQVILADRRPIFVQLAADKPFPAAVRRPLEIP